MLINADVRRSRLLLGATASVVATATCPVLPTFLMYRFLKKPLYGGLFVLSASQSFLWEYIFYYISVISHGVYSWVTGNFSYLQPLKLTEGDRKCHCMELNFYMICLWFTDKSSLWIKFNYASEAHINQMSMQKRKSDSHVVTTEPIISCWKPCTLRHPDVCGGFKRFLLMSFSHSRAQNNRMNLIVSGNI